MTKQKISIVFTHLLFEPTKHKVHKLQENLHKHNTLKTWLLSSQAKYNEHLTTFTMSKTHESSSNSSSIIQIMF